MNVRTELADHLRTQLPDTWTVQAKADVPDRLEPGRPLLIVWRSIVRRTAIRGVRQHDVSVWLVTATTDPARVDDELDELLAQLLDALDGTPLLTWNEAERGSLQDTHPGYLVTLTTSHTRDKE